MHIRLFKECIAIQYPYIYTQYQQHMDILYIYNYIHSQSEYSFKEDSYTRNSIHSNRPGVVYYQTMYVGGAHSLPGFPSLVHLLNQSCKIVHLQLSLSLHLKDCLWVPNEHFGSSTSIVFLALCQALHVCEVLCADRRHICEECVCDWKCTLRNCKNC